ncbi:MAG: sodium:proton antiporter [Clostridia bacterium]|nr:sodium:proton antiporter [Clostridia bacterium]
MIDQAYQLLYQIALAVLGIGLFFCLARAIIGPRIADRIVAVNMVGTLTICIISVLALMMNEGYLADVALIYTMLSFLAVVLLTKVYMGVYRERHLKKEEKTDA